jgi:hypothetical protein
LDGTDSIVGLLDDTAGGGGGGGGGFWSTSIFSDIWLVGKLIVDTAYVKKNINKNYFD